MKKKFSSVKEGHCLFSPLRACRFSQPERVVKTIWQIIMRGDGRFIRTDNQTTTALKSPSASYASFVLARVEVNCH